MKIGFKKGVSGLLAGLLLAAVAPASWGQTPVSIGAVPAISQALDGITGYPGVIEAFQAANPAYGTAYYKFNVTYKPSGTLETEIWDALSNSQSGDYDLFLAANVSDASDLSDTFSPTVGTPVNYAEGTLMLWSNGNTYSIDANSTPAYFAANYTTTGICGAGPYGVAASDALYNVYGIVTASNPKVIQNFQNINAVDSAIGSGGGELGGVQSGWVPTSLHCVGGAIVFARPNQNATYRVFLPGNDTYAPAIQAGVTIARTGHASATAAAQALLNWMATSAGQTVYQNFCLELNTEARIKAKGGNRVSDKLGKPRTKKKLVKKA